MTLLLTCMFIFRFDMGGWMYSVAAIVWLLQTGITYHFFKNIVDEALAEFARKAAEYNKAHPDE